MDVKILCLTLRSEFVLTENVAFWLIHIRIFVVS